MVTIDNPKEVTPFIRPRISGSANVLLLASDDAPGAGIACQNLLTTASERTERAIAIQYGSPKRSWLNRLKYEPTNLSCSRIYEGNSLPAQTKEFLETLGDEEYGIVYVDSISALAADFGVDNTLAMLSDTIQTLAPTNSIGFFRIDPHIIDPAPFQQLTKHTAVHKPTKQGWEISN